MFDIGWGELVLIGIAILIVVKPKDLPVFLRTVGQYVGVLKRQAAEFRTHFDDALRDTELEQIKNDVQGLRSEVEGSIKSTTNLLTDELRSAQKIMDDALDAPTSDTSVDDGSLTDVPEDALDAPEETPELAASQTPDVEAGRGYTGDYTNKTKTTVDKAGA